MPGRRASYFFLHLVFEARAYASRYLHLVMRQALLEDLADPRETGYCVSIVWRCWGGVGGVSET